MGSMPSTLNGKPVAGGGQEIGRETHGHGGGADRRWRPRTDSSLLSPHHFDIRLRPGALEVPVRVLGDDGLTDHVRRPGAGEEVVVLVGYLARGPNPS